MQDVGSVHVPHPCQELHRDVLQLIPEQRLLGVEHPRQVGLYVLKDDVEIPELRHVFGGFQNIDYSDHIRVGQPRYQ